MAFQGNAPTELRQAASMCMQGANAFGQLIQIMEATIRILETSAWGNWVRPYIMMLKRVVTILKQIVEKLLEYKGILTHNAGQQEAVSSTSGAGTPGAGRSPSPSPSRGFTEASNALNGLISAGSQLLNKLNEPPAPTAPTPMIPSPAAGEQPTVTPPTETGQPLAPVDTRTDTPDGQEPDHGPAAPHGGGGGEDTAGPGSADRPAQEYGQATVLGRSPLVGPHGAVLAATAGPETGEVTAEAIPLNGRSAGLATGLVASVVGVGAAGGMWAANRFGNQAPPDGETNTTT